jgi:hypothetical protein
MELQNMSQNEKPYGEEFEKTIIASMIALIVLAFIGVGVLWKMYPPFCNSADYTYCGDEPKVGSHN